MTKGNSDTKQLQAVIADDEALARKLLRNYIEKHGGMQIIAEYDNGVDLLKDMPGLKADILFLDIHMPRIDGFEVLELMAAPPAVIFTTAYDQYALKAFDFNAADYLLKPYSEERFAEAVSRAFQRIKGQTLEKKEPARNSDDDYLKRVIVRDGAQIHFIPLDKIQFLEAQDDYVQIVHASGALLKQGTLKYFEDHLPPEDFVRLHRSYIVRIQEIQKLEMISRENYLCILKSGKRIPVSKSGMGRLREIYI